MLFVVKTPQSVLLSPQLNSFLELWAPWGAEGSRCCARLGETSHVGLTPNLQCSLPLFGATLHFQCHQAPSLSLGVNYSSLTVVLGAQEGVGLNLPPTMGSGDGRGEGKKRGGSRPDQACSLPHTLSSFQLCLFACHNSRREKL